MRGDEICDVAVNRFAGTLFHLIFFTTELRTAPSLMKGRITFGLICAAVLAFACGPRAGTGDVASGTRAARAKIPAGGPALVSPLDDVVKDGVAHGSQVTHAGP